MCIFRFRVGFTFESSAGFSSSLSLDSLLGILHLPWSLTSLGLNVGLPIGFNTEFTAGFNFGVYCWV